MSAQSAPRFSLYLTAKPSNVFDHAVVSADYDYLTVGTELTDQCVRRYVYRRRNCAA